MGYFNFLILISQPVILWISSWSYCVSPRVYSLICKENGHLMNVLIHRGWIHARFKSECLFRLQIYHKFYCMYLCEFILHVHICTQTYINTNSFTKKPWCSETKRIWQSADSMTAKGISSCFSLPGISRKISRGTSKRNTNKIGFGFLPPDSLHVYSTHQFLPACLSDRVTSFYVALFVLTALPLTSPGP